jgi:hypothetical protein
MRITNKLNKRQTQNKQLINNTIHADIPHFKKSKTLLKKEIYF